MTGLNLDTLRLYLQHAKPYFPHAAALLFVGALGWLNGSFEASRSVDNPSLRETWEMPAWTPYQAGPARGTLATLDIWDGKKPQSTAKQPDVAQQGWTLVGTVRAGKTFAAVIQSGDGRVQKSAAGDVLPNGEKILAVGNGYMQIDAGGNQQEIKLFQQGN
jgi:hypothetical protein